MSYLDIIIGIDGTNSFGYRNRFIENFVRDVQCYDSRYLPGPTDYGGATGWECSAIFDRARNFIEATRRAVDRQFNQERIAAQMRARGTSRAIPIPEHRTPPELRISIVGHSRGGHTAIALAASLPIPVHFLGLYDAVDMTTVLGDTTVVRNVAYTYHAMRAPSMASRTSWGNTGTSAAGHFFQARYFNTNHGGMGGDTGDQDPNPIMGDVSCAYRPPVPRYRTVPGSDHLIEYPPPPPSRLGEMRRDIAVICDDQSAAVDQWIRSAARQRGLSFNRG